MIRDKELTALVGTECDVCIIRFYMLFVLGEINFVPERVKLFGIGDSWVGLMRLFMLMVWI